jgi:NAD(P)-dependent dehydrogenase (short-subunit alcohol dehydrogenase family)
VTYPGPRSLTHGTTVITGAASGLGLCTARLLAATGGHLVLVDLDGSRLARAADELRHHGGRVEAVVGDVASEGVADAVADAGRALPGGVARVFLSAGVDPLHARSVVDTSVALWDLVMAVNVRSAFLLTRVLIPDLIVGGGGSIVMTASSAAHRAAPGEAAYTVSKTALIGLARSIAIDFGDAGIRANCISPGPLEAVMTDRRADMSITALEQRRRGVEAAVPLGREGTYDEVARCVQFLLGPDSSYVTGTALVADGGLVS